MAGMKVKELEAEIMRLAPRDRVYLFDKLLHVMDGEDIEPDVPPANAAVRRPADKKGRRPR
jgi:hypothetical protein